ncbi:MAG: hypothetical protein Q9M26_09525 [Mariprofundales bacterium]|nr:hypothetical protein [Mariprofundales bacterium]
MAALHMEEHICPVCGMDSADSVIYAEHIGITYHCCTLACRENFLARPQLYVGKRALAISGRESMKCRRFALERRLDHLQQVHLRQALQRLMGIHRLAIETDRVSVTYNLLEVTAEQIERALSDAGLSLGSGWSGRLKRGWIHYSEENELDNLAAGDAHAAILPRQKDKGVDHDREIQVTTELTPSFPALPFLVPMLQRGNTYGG